MKSLRELYGLTYDESGFGSGLIRWYNKLIDKSVDELEIADVSKMIRQNILLDIATQKAINIFLYRPYDGEYQDGDLLSLLLTLDISQIDNEQLNELNVFLQELKSNYRNYDWESNQMRDQYAKELNDFEAKISKQTLPEQ